MDALLVSRIVATACLDGSLAVLTGLLLAPRWFACDAPRQAGFTLGPRPPALPCFAALLTLASGALLYLVTAEFSGQTSPRDCLQQMPAMFSTHAGKIDAQTLLAAFCLFGVSLLHFGDRLRLSLTVLLLCVVLLLRSASGHAAVYGDFTLAEFFQFLHLSGMAVWSGCILVSGLYLIPRLAIADTGSTHKALHVAFHTYMHRLSQASTWAVALVVFTGVWKSYHALGGDVRLLRSATWGYVLIAKTVFVSLALLLGAMNRLWLQRKEHWDNIRLRRSVLALRLEAMCMLVVLALSAALGSLSPPQLP